MEQKRIKDRIMRGPPAYCPGALHEKLKVYDRDLLVMARQKQHIKQSTHTHTRMTRSSMTRSIMTRSFTLTHTQGVGGTDWAARSKAECTGQESTPAPTETHRPGRWWAGMAAVGSYTTSTTTNTAGMAGATTARADEKSSTCCAQDPRDDGGMLAFSAGCHDHAFTHTMDRSFPRWTPPIMVARESTPQGV